MCSGIGDSQSANPLGNSSSQAGSQNSREASHSIPGTIAMVTYLALFILKMILWGEFVYPFILVHGLAACPRAHVCTHVRRLMLKLPVFLYCSPACCLRKGLSLNLEVTPSEVSWPASLKELSPHPQTLYGSRGCELKFSQFMRNP